MQLPSRVAYGGLWRFLAVFLIGMAVAALVLLLLVKRIMPEVSGALLGTILRGFGL